MSDEIQAVAVTVAETEKFQPTVWIESLASVLASFLADPRLRYSQGVQPNVVDGELCLLVATWLKPLIAPRTTTSWILPKPTR